jgi:DNA-binding NarL/FixJ family response regulator
MLPNNRTITLIDPSPKLREEFENHFTFNKYSNNKIQYICTNTVESYTEFSHLRLHTREHIDYLFLDVDLLEESEMDVITKLKTKLFGTEIIIYTNQIDKNIFFKTLKLGASGYLLKNIPVRNLFQYLDLVEEGGAAISPLMNRYLINEFNHTGNEIIRQKQITSRQFEILSLLVDGKRNKEISKILNLTTNAIQQQCTKLYKNLGVNSKEEAIKVFYERKNEFLLESNC